METERGGVVESSLTFSYVPIEDTTGSAGGGVIGGAGRLSSVSGTFLGGVAESPLLSNKKTRQSGKPVLTSLHISSGYSLHTCACNIANISVGQFLY